MPRFPRDLPTTEQPFIGFDIETYSPNGFPHKCQDPIVSATLAVTPDLNMKNGLIVTSWIGPPSLERELLNWFHEFLVSNGPGCLVTYNGTLFDINYVIQRGKLHSIDYERAFERHMHFDLYEAIRSAHLVFPSYGQKTIEKCFGFSRVVDGVNGATYHHSFRDYLNSGDMAALLYNIEDSVGCLRIANALSINPKISFSKSFKTNHL